MSISTTFEKTSGTTGAYISVSPSFGTMQSSTDHVLPTSSIAIPASVVIAEAEAIIHDAYIRAYYDIGPEKTHESLSRGYAARLAQAKARYGDKIDIDVPIINDGGDW